ncbi:MAG: argininosuccinate lyase [Aquiluna sp.]|nr:argininosuccinate lyase [Aquiluna sp.]MCF8545988.1 argininosuccinate lyase [Aquiluna sp.]
MAQSNDSLWGGRFESGPSHALAALSKSTHFDWRLASYDLAGTNAHIKALAAAGFLSQDEVSKLQAAISELDDKIKAGEFAPKFEEEDVHAALERGLIEIAGAETAGKVRAGRSRNDQIATLIRSFLLDASDVIESELVSFIEVLMERAKEHGDAVMPGRTHFQHAQPVLLSHHLLAHAWPQVRNLERLSDWRRRAKLSPYGAGALAGNTLGLDPELVAKELGFDGTTQNSMDATSSRDVVAEFAFIASMIGIDLSRFAEEIIAWSTYEFGYVKLHDSFSTGSSIMPQKKNPDIAELARGKAGRLIGNLTGLLSTLKGLPLSYNRDLQEDKEPVFDSVDTLLVTLPAFTGMVATLKFDLERMASLAPLGFALATDVAEWLVKQGVVFRDAHEITGELVKFCEEHSLELHEPTDEQYLSISMHLLPELRSVLSVESAITSRNGAGGTSKSQAEIQLSKLEAFLASREN